jgi:hypothetical protein
MALTHRGFLLNAKGFEERATPILAALDAGDAQPLFAQAVLAFERTTPDQWPFRQCGERLLDIRKVDTTGRAWQEPIERQLGNIPALHPSDIGYWLLLILSAFVERRPDIDIGDDYPILDGVLQILGWSEENRRLIFEGIPISALFESRVPPIEQIDSRHYWNYARPYSSRAAGWLSQRQTSELHRRLLTERKSTETFDPKRFGDRFMGRRLTVPEGQFQYLKLLHFAYGRATRMLKAARQAETELYVVLSYE